MELESILDNLGNLHFPSGPIHADTQKCKALFEINKNEMKAIHHLVEAHAPGLRFKAAVRYNKNLINKTKAETKGTSDKEIEMPLKKEYVNLSCSTESADEAVEKLLGKLGEMPEEWTMVQLTMQYCADKRNDVSAVNLKFYTPGLFLTVFHCGSNAPKPFCVEIPAPTNFQTDPVEILQEMYNIQTLNKTRLLQFAGQKCFKNEQEKEAYRICGNEVNARLKNLILDMQNFWLKQWRFLIAGKLVDKKLEQRIENELRQFILKEKGPDDIIPERSVCILMAMVKNAGIMPWDMFVKLMIHLFPSERNVQFRIALSQFMKDLSVNIEKERRHPIILILDEPLDNVPWECIDVLVNEPVSRVSSFHIAYALYKEHQASIVDGYKIVTDFKNGSSVVNPGLDLKKMEVRMGAFLKYWLPTYKTVIGKAPTEKQFKDMLTKSAIFTYSGHGTGTQYFSNLSIEKIRINAVVFLFGCSSTALQFMSHQTEMYGTNQSYLLASCPCLIGMLWEVVDLDTDYLTTEFLSMWIPSDAKIHWKRMCKAEWQSGVEVDFIAEANDSFVEFLNYETVDSSHEPDLLRAASMSKKSPNVRHLKTKAAMVARGIPVKIQS